MVHLEGEKYDFEDTRAFITCKYGKNWWPLCVCVCVCVRVHTRVMSELRWNSTQIFAHPSCPLKSFRYS
jgi:hypothetical protein